MAQNPVFILIPKNTWVLVAEGVTRGQVSIIKTSPEQHLSAYRVAGDPAPTLVNQGIPLSRNSNQIKSRDPIDVYIFVQNVDSKVRIDL